MHVAGPLSQTSKGQRKKLGVDGSLTSCGDAQKESENKAFIPVFDPIQSVKSTNKVTLRYTRVSQKPGKSTLAYEVCIWLGPSHRQAKHNEKTLELMGSLTSCEDTKET